MAISRRRFIAGAGALAGAGLLTPVTGLAGPAFGKTAPQPDAKLRRRLVVIFLAGGNDGLNTVAPRGDVRGAARASVYRKVRPSLAYAPEVLLPLDRGPDAAHALGLNPQLTTIHGWYRQGRVAVVQGVDYPSHSYSHFTSTDIWHSGNPTAPISGWLGRHLDRAGVGEGELRAVGIGSQLPLILRGEVRQGLEIVDVPSTRFSDGEEAAARARHDSLALFADQPADEDLRGVVGRMGRSTVAMVRRMQGASVPAATGQPLVDRLTTARVLLELDLGVECIYLEHAGFDTHAAQRTSQESLLTQLDTALAGFWSTLAPTVASRTMVMIVSEFGRRIGEAAAGSTAGTDHGAAAPVLMIGPPGGGGLVGGIHGEHPDMGTTALPADNLVMTTDVRRVYADVLGSWLSDPDPLYVKKHKPVGLFTLR